MAVPFIFAFFVVSHLVLLHSAGEDHSIHQHSCPQSLNCGTLGQIKFPFANTTHPQCGLITVNCSGKIPKINLGWGTWYWYEVKEFSKSDSMKVSEKWLGTLISLKSCDLFTFTLPNSSSISYTISHNLTLFKCANNATLSSDFFRDKHNYTGCSGYTVYYAYPNDLQVPATPGSFPPNCVPIQLPAASAIGNRNASDVFSLLASEFSLGFYVSNECHECHLSQGQCARDLQEFQCVNLKEKEGRSNLTLILGTVIPTGFLLLLCLLILTIRRCNKWNYISSYISSRNTPLDPSSKEDLEGSSVYFGVPVFSYTQLEEATHNFDPSEELGDGGFGTVYHGKLQDGRQVAVKRLHEHNYKRVTQFMNEIEILTRLDHRNLVTLYGCTSLHSRELLLIYEYIPNGTVADHLHGDRAKDGSLTWPIRMNIAVETASALAYLHASDIIHRDVKTNNILLDNNFCVKVADFGLSRLFPTDVSHVSTAPQGTPGYVDPEYHQCYQLTDKSDVYSFGVVLIELISSMPAVDISRHRHEINLANLAINRIQNRALNELIDPSLGFESDPSIERMATLVAEVAFRCLQLKKEMRPSMNEVLEALKGIQEYKDENIGEEIENVGVLAIVGKYTAPFA